jgi:hypothetical protein
LRLPIITASKAWERVLSDGELAEVWSAANTIGYPFGPFFKLAIFDDAAARGSCRDSLVGDFRRCGLFLGRG